jgi:hypothetical protein
MSVLCTGDIESWIKSLKSDSMVEAIDLLMRLRDELTKYSAFFVVEGQTVRFAYISIITADTVSSKEPLPEIIHKSNRNDDDEIDLASLKSILNSSPSHSKHIKAKTAPLPSKPWSTITDTQFVVPPMIKESATVDTTVPFVKGPSQFIEKLKQSSQARRSNLMTFGEFIPSVEQYSQLMSQTNLLLSLLPKELGESFQ